MNEYNQKQTPALKTKTIFILADSADQYDSMSTNTRGTM